MFLSRRFIIPCSLVVCSRSYIAQRWGPKFVNPSSSPFSSRCAEVDCWGIPPGSVLTCPLQIVGVFCHRMVCCLAPYQCLACALQLWLKFVWTSGKLENSYCVKNISSELSGKTGSTAHAPQSVNCTQSAADHHPLIQMIPCRKHYWIILATKAQKYRKLVSPSSGCVMGSQSPHGYLHLPNWSQKNIG